MFPPEVVGVLVAVLSQQILMSFSVTRLITCDEMSVELKLFCALMLDPFPFPPSSHAYWYVLLQDSLLVRAKTNRMYCNLLQFVTA